MPDWSKYEAEVKLNKGALKREKALVDKEQEELKAKLRMAEQGLKDQSEFDRWREAQ